MELVGFAIGYLLGSIPFGLLLTAIAGIDDIRNIGSGNIGATNVLRTGNKALAALTLLLDATKGYVAVILMELLYPGRAEPFMAAAMGAMIGHCFPVWLRFRGGKGVATLLGVATAFHWEIGAIFAGVWLLALLLTRISSVGGILAAISVPVSAWVIRGPRVVVMLALLAALVIVQHRGNIARLLRGAEPRVGRKK